MKKFLPLKLLVALDSAAQWTGSLWQLTPSVFVRAQAGGSPSVRGETGFFRCPECGHPDLETFTGGLICKKCKSRWGYQDGIYDFRKPLD